MPTINQYCRALERVLADQLGVRWTIPPRPIHGAAVTAPDSVDFLTYTYGLSLRDLDNVYRIGIGRKLSENDSLIYDDLSVERPKVDEELGGILCPLGILSFYEDVFYQRGRDTNILTASYHFQTAPQNGRHPLYVRFEFDPLVANPPRDFAAKPIFHYHFSNYRLFHKSCHFPAGHFEVPNHYPFNHRETQQFFRPPDVLTLETFLQLLVSAGLIIMSKPPALPGDSQSLTVQGVSFWGAQSYML